MKTKPELHSRLTTVYEALYISRMYPVEAVSPRTRHMSMAIKNSHENSSRTAVNQKLYTEQLLIFIITTHQSMDISSQYMTYAKTKKSNF